MKYINPAKGIDKALCLKYPKLIEMIRELDSSEIRKVFVTDNNKLEINKLAFIQGSLRIYQIQEVKNKGYIRLKEVIITEEEARKVIHKIILTKALNLTSDRIGNIIKLQKEILSKLKKINNK